MPDRLPVMRTVPDDPPPEGLFLMDGVPFPKLPVS